jgi:hypothetical protein
MLCGVKGLERRVGTPLGLHRGGIPERAAVLPEGGKGREPSAAPPSAAALLAPPGHGAARGENQTALILSPGDELWTHQSQGHSYLFFARLIQMSLSLCLRRVLRSFMRRTDSLLFPGLPAQVPSSPFLSSFLKKFFFFQSCRKQRDSCLRRRGKGWIRGQETETSERLFVFFFNMSKS